MPILTRPFLKINLFAVTILIIFLVGRYFFNFHGFLKKTLNKEMMSKIRIKEISSPEPKAQGELL